MTLWVLNSDYLLLKLYLVIGHLFLKCLKKFYLFLRRYNKLLLYIFHC